MGMQELKKAIEIINNFQEDADFEGEKSESLINNAEKRLNVNFPPTYKFFLKNYGCGAFKGIEIYGLIDNNFENSGIPDAIWITLKERKDSNLPEELIIIYYADDLGYFAINTAQQNIDGESPVVIWIPGISDKNNLKQVAENFGQFLYEEFNGVL